MLTVKELEERAARKDQAYSDLRKGIISSVEYFEAIGREWWNSQTDKVRGRIDFFEYLRHLARAHAGSGSFVTPEVRQAYPPPTGPVHIEPEGDEYHLRPIKNPGCSRGR